MNRTNVSLYLVIIRTFMHLSTCYSTFNPVGIPTHLNRLFSKITHTAQLSDLCQFYKFTLVFTQKVGLIRQVFFDSEFKFFLEIYKKNNRIQTKSSYT